MAPQHAAEPLLAGELLEGEGVDRVGLLAVRQAQQEARRGEAEIGRSRQVVQRAERVLHQRVLLVHRDVQGIGADAGDERGAGGGGDLRDPAEQVGVRGGQLEIIQADDRRQRALMRVERRLLDQHAVQPGVFQPIGRGDVGGQFLGRDVVQHDLHPRAGLDPADQELDAAPDQFGGLEIRVVQHPAHGGRQRLVHLGDQRVLARILGGLDVGADQAGEQRIGIRLLRGGGGGAADQAGEVRQPAGGHRAAAGAARMRARRRRTAPGHDLLRRPVEPGAVGQVAAQGAQFLEQRNVPGELVGVEIIDRADLDRDGAAVLGQRQGEAELHARQHVVEIIDIDLDRLARGERGARFELARIGAAGKIAEQRETEFLARGRRARCGSETAETDLVFHAGPPRPVRDPIIAPRRGESPQRRGRNEDGGRAPPSPRPGAGRAPVRGQRSGQRSVRDSVRRAGRSR